MKYYLVYVYGCVEPTIAVDSDGRSAFDSWEKLLAFAREFNKGLRLEDSLFYLMIGKDSVPGVYSFTNDDLEGD